MGTEIDTSKLDGKKTRGRAENLTNAGKGRPKGVPNKATKSLKELARVYTADALTTLAKIMMTSESDTARVSAANALLDRGYGKPSTVLAGDEDGGAIRTVNEIIIRGVKPLALPAP